ncbi:MAG: hypothetical protein JSV65_01735 [Armatimonadota bacterium]|nr:MAG: hypothetical protein JSV65_01735 [Armatimonadota bacterium]
MKWMECAAPVLISLIMVLSVAVRAGSVPEDESRQGMFPVTSFGAKGDGAADDTAAIQRAIDAAAKLGGIVTIPAGKFLVAGSLTVPAGVTVRGINTRPLYIEPAVGTIILATGGRDNEEAPALFELRSGAVEGITVHYPDQKPTDIHPYPWTFHCAGGDDTIQDITLINSYNGIRTGPEGNVRHLIRNVFGCVLRRGIFVDACTDIGRIENVQFHCHYWSHPAFGGAWDPVFEYMWKNLEAFIFARTDWEYVLNTFVFPTRIGYHFIETERGACNGQFCGIGSDASEYCVVVDAIQYMGLLITNGQFVSFTGENPVEIVVNPTCRGSVRMTNCAFWGPTKQVAVLKGEGFVSFENCYISDWGKDDPQAPGIDVQAGRFQLRGCSFKSDRPAVRLGPDVVHAVVTDNNGDHGVRVMNEAGERAVIANNEPPRDD